MLETKTEMAGGAELGGRFKILIVEDDALIAMELGERLGELGYDVIGPAATLEEADALVAAQRPDAALLDASLGPGRTTVALGASLAEQGVPVAFCTGYDSIRDLPPSLVKAPLLTKPISDGLLASTLKKLLG